MANDVLLCSNDTLYCTIAKSIESTIPDYASMRNSELVDSILLDNELVIDILNQKKILVDSETDEEHSDVEQPDNELLI